MRWSIRYQLLLPLLLLLLGVMAASAWTAWAYAGRAREQIETQLRDAARTLGGATYPLTPNVLNQMKGLSGAEFIHVPPEGRHVATLEADTGELPSAAALADDWQELRLGAPAAVGDRRFLCGGVRLGPPRGGALYILYPEARWRDALWDAMWPSLVLGGVVGLASLALAVGLGRRLTQRLQELDRRTRLIAGGDFAPVPLTGPRDELRALSESVNEMAQHLARLQEAVRKTERLRLLGQVSGGLAHQLRNGVTGARLAVQLHARECAADTEALDVALRQLSLVEANLKRFLDLGKTAEPRREPCALSPLVSQAIALYQPQCKHAHTELSWQPPFEDIIVVGDTGQLEHLALNVIGNAVEAAGPGGRVEVRLGIAEEAAVLEVADTGPGPPADLTDRLFEPFVTGKRDGVGLGLAVARQAAEAHGGRITWRRAGGLTVFRIDLPREPTSEPNSAG